MKQKLLSILLILSMLIVWMPSSVLAADPTAAAALTEADVSVSAAGSFADVQDASAYYYTPVLWAVAQGITSGTTPTTFGPDEACTRAQVVTFLYRAAGSPAVSAGNPFADVHSGDYYYNAVLWAVKNGITSGTSATSFSPTANCTRGQVACFLYRNANVREETGTLDENGTYDSRDEVARYLHQYGHLPHNYITQQEAQALGWPGGSLEPYAPGKCIGGGYFGNYEGLLPAASGREYHECDLDTLGASSRGAKRLVYSNDGLIYYTEDHYKTFTLLYGADSH